LVGRFDIFVKNSSGTPDDQIAALPDVIRQQLGLKLERQKEIVEMVIIDSAEKRPIAN
jgi:uncharacterized protein (TIGR03435 family)